MSASALKELEQEEMAPTSVARSRDPWNEFPRPYNVALPLGASDRVILHVRYNRDATIADIAERPEGLSKDEWFKLLCARAGDRYETRIGGRGFFRLTRMELESIKTLKAQ
jgi:hypothetical protein